VIRFLAEAFPGFTSRPAAFLSPARRVSFWSCVMEVPLSKLLEEAVDIAWVYLHRTGEIVDGIVAARFLTDTIETMIRRGQRNRMFLANMAILKYRASRSNVVDIREHA
jgi:hypothetical protein